MSLSIMKPIASQDHRDGLGLADLMTIYADEPDPQNGNASHEYRVDVTGIPRREFPLVWDPDYVPGATLIGAEIHFQHGPRSEDSSVPGILDSVLVAILLDRYRAFQQGPFACRENSLVITKLEEALHWMQHRARRRAAAGTLGTRTPS